MQLLSEVSRPYIVDSLTSPVGASHFWIYDAHMMDFKLEPLAYLEETTGPTITVMAQNLQFDLPASWLVMAVDEETLLVDCIPIAHCANFDHALLLFSPDNSKLVTTKLRVLDFNPKASIIHPMVPKASAMIHPTGPEAVHGKQCFYGIVCGPHDLHRWTSGHAVGELLG